MTQLLQLGAEVAKGICVKHKVHNNDPWHLGEPPSYRIPRSLVIYHSNQISASFCSVYMLV